MSAASNRSCEAMLFLWWCGTYVCPFPSGAWPCLVANTTEIVKLNALVYVFKEVVRSVMYVYRSLPLDNCLELSFFFPLVQSYLILSVFQTPNPQIQSCGRMGHIARVCPNGNGFTGNATGPGYASRVPPPGRGLNTASLPPVKCFRCGGFNHMSK